MSVGVPPADSNDAIERYWYWNVQRLLPVPPRRAAAWFVPEGDSPVPDAASMVPAATTAAATAEPTVETTWLMAKATSPEPAVRSAVLRAFGGLGPAGRGLPVLLRGLADPSPQVQDAAALALGEHGGAAARFALVKLLADEERREPLRALAALGLGIAARVDGVLPIPELHRAALPDGAVHVREAACAALVLAGARGCGDEAREWFAGPAAPRSAPAVALCNAVADLERPGAAGFLRQWLGAVDEGIRLAAIAAAVRNGCFDEAKLRVAVARPAAVQAARAVLVAAAWPGLPFELDHLAAEARPAHAVALGVNARDFGRSGAWRALAAGERADHRAGQRPLWLLAEALAGDPAAGARVRLELRSAIAGETPRWFAIQAAGMLGDEGIDEVRDAAQHDPSLRIRRAAAFLCAHRAGDEDFAVLRRAFAAAPTGAERASLLVAIGRTRRPGAAVLLRRIADDPAGPDELREAAWTGIVHLVRRADRPPLLALAERGGHEALSPWLLAVVDGVR